ncbi:MAG: lipoyl(octanoyl) transferase [Verrucomicrobiota bacterium]|jgi:lipoate-protein ligase A
MSIFGSLDICHDESSRSAALNMAMDEALLEAAEIPTIRFYKWDHPALSFGYFGKFTEVASHAAERDLVRRWTGGGIVLHGDDMTYSIVIPAADPAFSESSMSIYEEIHNAIRAALVANGQRADLAEGRDAALQRPRTAQRAVPTNACFDNPVRADVLSNGRKVAGAAQRRTRRGLLQQGSIQGVDLTKNFADQFAMELCSEGHDKTLDEHLIARAHEIAGQKYETQVWLRKR